VTTAYLVTGTRTAIGRHGGRLAPVRPDDLASHVIRALVDRTPSMDYDAVDDVILGCANQVGEDNRNVGRMAALLAGLPRGDPGQHREPAVRIRPGRPRDRRPGHSRR
jgi:acetyl-CoA acetyltransferase